MAHIVYKVIPKSAGPKPDKNQVVASGRWDGTQMQLMNKLEREYDPKIYRYVVKRRER